MSQYWTVHLADPDSARTYPVRVPTGPGKHRRLDPAQLEAAAQAIAAAHPPTAPAWATVGTWPLGSYDPPRARIDR